MSIYPSATGMGLIGSRDNTGDIESETQWQVYTTESKNAVLVTEDEAEPENLHRLPLLYSSQNIVKLSVQKVAVIVMLAGLFAFSIINSYLFLRSNIILIHPLIGFYLFVFSTFLLATALLSLRSK